MLIVCVRMYFLYYSHLNVLQLVKQHKHLYIISNVHLNRCSLLLLLKLYTLLFKISSFISHESENLTHSHTNSYVYMFIAKKTIKITSTQINFMKVHLLHSRFATLTAH